MQTLNRYSWVAIVFHWVLAVAILVSFAVGTYMVDLPFSPQRLKFYNWHKWVGITILALSALRLIWRLIHTPPKDVAMPAIQRTMSHVSHWGLYALFFAVPLLGWAYSSAAGFSIVLFGIWPLSDWVYADQSLAEWIKPWHQRLAWAMMILVVVHLGAALYHQFILRDGLLSRMWLKKGNNK
jgi:cytochrome b561